ncbi:MAG: hypothetical protein JKY93_01735, partial [Gammaproteobacteria bacterium]|nr:hypothetical protein [Gammaproteobacteria bacterium]
MKLHRALEVGGDDKRIIDDDVRLNLSSPGSAFFVVESDERLSGIVRFSIGYSLDKMQRFFIGYVESSTTIDSKQQKIFCRELTASLSRRI